MGDLDCLGDAEFLVWLEGAACLGLELEDIALFGLLVGFMMSFWGGIVVWYRDIVGSGSCGGRLDSGKKGKLGLL